MAKFSRSGRTNPLGKCSEEVKFKTDPETAERYKKESAAVGVPVSEYLRIKLYLADGLKDVLLDSYKAQIEAIEQMGRERASKRYRPLAVVKKGHLRRVA